MATKTITKTKYYSLKNPLKTERTPMGYLGRIGVKNSRSLKAAFTDNYKTMSEKALLKSWFPALTDEEKKTIVVITAHDDDLITFSGIMAKLAAEYNAEIHHLILTDGSMGCGEDALLQFSSRKELARLRKELMVPKKGANDNGYIVRGSKKAWDEYAELLRKGGKNTAEIRQSEARDAEKILGWHSTYFLDFQDAALGQYNFGLSHYGNPGAMAVVMRLVRDINPDLMVLQDRNQVVDLNPDHYAAGWIGYTCYWHLHCPVLGVDGMDKPFKAVVQRGFEGISRPEFRYCDWLVHLEDKYLRQKLESLYAYKNQMELVNDLFNVNEMEKFRIEGFFDVDAPSATLY